MNPDLTRHLKPRCFAGAGSGARMPEAFLVGCGRRSGPVGMLWGALPRKRRHVRFTGSEPRPTDCIRLSCRRAGRSVDYLRASHWRRRAWCRIHAVSGPTEFTSPYGAPSAPKRCGGSVSHSDFGRM